MPKENAVPITVDPSEIEAMGWHWGAAAGRYTPAQTGQTRSRPPSAGSYAACRGTHRPRGEKRGPRYVREPLRKTLNYMSFASQVKGEYVGEKVSRPCCARAEAYGILLFCNSFTPQRLRVTTRSAGCPAPAQAVQKCVLCGFDVRPADTSTGGRLSFEVTDPKKMERILETYGYAQENSISHHINYAVLEEVLP